MFGLRPIMHPSKPAGKLAGMAFRPILAPYEECDTIWKPVGWLPRRPDDCRV